MENRDTDSDLWNEQPDVAMSMLLTEMNEVDVVPEGNESPDIRRPSSLNLQRGHASRDGVRDSCWNHHDTGSCDSRLDGVSQEVAKLMDDQQLDTLSREIAVMRSTVPPRSQPPQAMLHLYADPPKPAEFVFREFEFKRRYGPHRAALSDAPLLHERSYLATRKAISVEGVRNMLVEAGGDPGSCNSLRLYAHTLKSLDDASRRKFFDVRGAMPRPEEKNYILPPMGPFCTTVGKVDPTAAIPGLFQVGGPVRVKHGLRRITRSCFSSGWGDGKEARSTKVFRTRAQSRESHRKGKARKHSLVEMQAGNVGVWTGCKRQTQYS